MELDRAIELRANGRYEEALQLLKSLLEDAGGSKYEAVMHGEIGGIYLYDLSSPTEALVFFEKCVRISPRSELASLGKFHALAMLGQYDEAFDEMRRLVSLRPSEEYRSLIADLLAKKEPGK